MIVVASQILIDVRRPKAPFVQNVEILANKEKWPMKMELSLLRGDAPMLKIDVENDVNKPERSK